MTECIFGWGKQHGTMRKTNHRGIAAVAADFLSPRPIEGTIHRENSTLTERTLAQFLSFPQTARGTPAKASAIRKNGHAETRS
jgi:hypothetical protein